MNKFEEGYTFFENNTGSYISSFMGDSYVREIEKSIEVLKSDLNSFNGYETSPGALKGDIAEFWHSDTFNINAVLRGSKSRTIVDRSHDFASPDISSNWGEKIGLKYYKSGTDSAKQQAKSVFERYKEYQAQGGKDSIDVFLSKRSLKDIDSVLNDPIYNGQIRVIPKGQLEEATKWLRRKIAEEQVKRSEQVERYQETLNMLTDKIRDGKGTESISLTKNEAEQLAKLAKTGEVSDAALRNLGLSTENLIAYEYIVKQAFNAGITAATISMVLRVAPEIYKCFSFLLQTGEINDEQIRNIGLSALQGGADGFVRGSISAAITTACKAGICGSLKEVNPSVIGAVTVIAMDTMKNAFKVASGEMESRELANELVKELFVSSCSLIGGGISQSFIEIPVIGFLIGSFLGSVIGSFAYETGYSAMISFCIDTGFTMFGLVDQNYELPNETIESIGIEVFRYEEFQFEEFHPEEFKIEEFHIKEFHPECLSIKPIRRGIIGVNRIGYV